MLQLSLNNTLLDLDAATSITLVAVNPIFDLENIQRVFSYPFRIPVTPHNAHVFQHVQRMNVEGPRKYTGAKLYSSGIFLEEGVILVLGRTADYIEIAFQNTQIDWIELLKKLRLRDLDWPVIVPGADYFPILRFYYTEATSEEPLQRYVFQINDTLYDQANTPDDLLTAINDDFPNLASLNFVPASDAFYLLIDTSEAPEEFLINLQPTVVQDPATEYFYPQYQPDASFTGGGWKATAPIIIRTSDTAVMIVERRGSTIFARMEVHLADGTLFEPLSSVSVTIPGWLRRRGAWFGGQCPAPADMELWASWSKYTG